MMDHLGLLESKLDKTYEELASRIADVRFVKDWEDWNFRAGYLQAMRDVGGMIKEVRSPEAFGEGGIPDILTEEQING